MPAISFCQTFNFVIGDPVFMEKNSNPSVQGLPEDQFMMRANVADGTYVLFYDEQQTKVCQKGFMKSNHRDKSWSIMACVWSSSTIKIVLICFMEGV